MLDAVVAILQHLLKLVTACATNPFVQSHLLLKGCKVAAGRPHLVSSLNHVLCLLGVVAVATLSHGAMGTRCDTDAFAISHNPPSIERDCFFSLHARLEQDAAAL